jgi:hypothetical protein
MKRYEIRARVVVDDAVVVDARNEDEAMEKAHCKFEYEHKNFYDCLVMEFHELRSDER